MSKLIGVVGSRRRDSVADHQKLILALDWWLDVGDMLISGGCHQGADKFAEIEARRRGLSIVIHHAEWNRHGKIAGFLRNTKIAEHCHMLIALRHPDKTGGTEDTIKKALKLGKMVVYV